MTTRDWAIVVWAAFIISAPGLISCRRHGEGGARSESDAATVRRARPSVAALGRLEPRGGIIEVSGLPGERLDKLLVAEGDHVTAGQELAYLSSYPLRQSERQLAETQLSEAQARSRAERAYAEALVAEAETALEELQVAKLDKSALAAKIDALESNLTIAQRDQERLSGAGSAVSPQEQEHQELVVKQAKAELHSARVQMAKLDASRATHEREGKAKLQTARANLDRVKSSTQLASLEKGAAAAAQKLEMSIVRAPREGRVLEVLAHVGETMGPRPMLRLGDTEQMYATAEIYETDIYLIRPGQSARISSDALSVPINGTVESVGKTISKNQVVSLDPTAAADARVVRTRIRLDDSSEAANLIDLQVDVLIDTETSASAPPSDESSRKQ